MTKLRKLYDGLCFSAFCLYYGNMVAQVLYYYIRGTNASVHCCDQN